MKKTLSTIIIAAAAALAWGGETRADNSGTGWTLTDEGVLTVTQEYEWADAKADYPWDADREAVTSVVIEPGVTRVGNEAFASCTKLTKGSIPDGVEQIGYSSFQSCWSLTGITLPESVTEIGGSAFAYNFNFTTVNIPKGVTTLRRSVFNTCAISDITVPDGVTTIENGAFYSCWSLKHVRIPESVTEIREQAFLYCDSLEYVECAGGSPANIGLDAFPCNICALYVPSGSLEAYEESDWKHIFPSISDGAIGTAVKATVGNGWKCEDDKVSISTEYEWDSPIVSHHPWEHLHYTYAELQDGVTKIGDYAFYTCRDLEAIKIPESIKSIGVSAFEYCNSLTEISIPEAVANIGNSAFDGCSALRSINIPQNVTYISSVAFESCRSLANITIPGNVTHIDYGAFRLCEGLKYVISESETVPEIDESEAFPENLCPLYVPDAAVKAYKSSTWGSYFSDIRPLSEFTTAAKNVNSGRSVARVVNGEVEAEGLRAVYDLSGRRMPDGRQLPTGIYVVDSAGGRAKVIVR